MGFALKAFVTGAAGALSEKLDQDEKTAQESAKIVTTRLTNRMIERNKEIEEKVNGQSKTIDALKAYAPFTEAQLYAIARNPLVAEETLSAFKEGRVDPTRFNPETFVKLADTTPDKRTAKERIRDEYAKQELGAVPAIPEEAGFLQARAARIQQREVAKIAAAYGTTPEQLYGAAKPLRAPEATDGATFDMAQVAKAQPVEQQEARILNDITRAKQSNDPEALSKATENAAQFAASKRLMSASLSAEQALIDKIMAQPENAKLSPEAQLRKRQTLEIKPGEGIQRLSASDISRAARGAFNDALANSLGKGKFSTVTNQVTGETTTVPTDLVKPEELATAKTAARQGIINLYTDPRTGLPVSNLYKNALIEIGAQFNPDGTVVRVDSGKAKPEAQGNPAAAAQTKPESSSTAIESALKSQNIAYEPDKYDYRLEADGSVAARAKSAPATTETKTAPKTEAKQLLPWQEKQIEEARKAQSERKARADAELKAKQEKEAADKKREEELNAKTKAALRAGLPTK